MLDEISELVRVVNRHKISHLSLFDAATLKEDTNPIAKLYNVAAQQGLTDADASALIYGAGATTDARYRKLKSRLRRRLLNTLFVIDTEANTGYSEYQQAYINCHKDWALVRLLQAYGCRVTALSVARELLRTAEKWQFTDITLMTTMSLSYVYALEGDMRQQQKYNKLSEQARQTYYDELQCSMAFDEALAWVNKRSHDNKKLTAHIKEQYAVISNIAYTRKDIFRVQLFERRMAIIEAEHSGDIKKLLTACDNGEILINNNKQFYQGAILAEFVLNHMQCYLRLKDFKQGALYYSRIRELLAPQTGNFLFLQFYYILLQLQGGKYEEAALVFNNALDHPRFKTQTQPMMARWRLIEAALNYVMNEGLIKTRKVKSIQGRAFNIFKLINDLSAFSADKAGLNMALQSIQIAFLMQQGKFKQVSALQTNFYTYISRYLKNNDNQSATLFLRMMNILISSNFNVMIAKPKTKALFDKLEHLPPSLSQDVTTDVLPYTWLWEVILKQCDK